MDYLMLAILIIISIVLAMALFFVIAMIIVTLSVVSIGSFIAQNILDAASAAEHEYAPYLYNKYKIFKMKKDFGRLYINEPFIWTDEQDDEQRRLAFEYATTVHEVIK